MTAADTSTWVAFLQGVNGQDVVLLDKALQDRQVLMAPVVLTELLSDPKLPAEVAATLSEVPLIEIRPAYWQRAGVLRAKVLAKRRKARLGDALIAQSCIDSEVPSSRGIVIFSRSLKPQDLTSWRVNAAFQPHTTRGFESCGCLAPHQRYKANAASPACR